METVGIEVMQASRDLDDNPQSPTSDKLQDPATSHFRVELLLWYLLEGFCNACQAL